MSEEGVCRTALSTPGLLKTNPNIYQRLGKVTIKSFIYIYLFKLKIISGHKTPISILKYLVCQ